MAGTNKSQASVTSGGSLLTVVGIVFLTLKLAKVIDWSWWLVLLPFYGPLAAVLAAVVVVGGFILLLKATDRLLEAAIRRLSR